MRCCLDKKKGHVCPSFCTWTKSNNLVEHSREHRENRRAYNFMQEVLLSNKALHLMLLDFQLMYVHSRGFWDELQTSKWTSITNSKIAFCEDLLSTMTSHFCCKLSLLQTAWMKSPQIPRDYLKSGYHRSARLLDTEGLTCNSRTCSFMLDFKSKRDSKRNFTSATFSGRKVTCHFV